MILNNVGVEEVKTELNFVKFVVVLAASVWEQFLFVCVSAAFGGVGFHPVLKNWMAFGRFYRALWFTVICNYFLLAIARDGGDLHYLTHSFVILASGRSVLCLYLPVLFSKLNSIVK